MRLALAIAVALVVGLDGRAAADPVDDPAAAAFDVISTRAQGCVPGDVDALIAALPAAPSPGVAADALFTTARGCETRGGDPSVALALYRRILREHPDSRAAVGAALRAQALIALIGEDGSGAAAARRLSELRATHGANPDDAALAEADQLAHAAWPGAGEAAQWRADRLRDLGRLAEAATGYDDVVARFPSTAWAARAAESAVVVAIQREQFDDARRRIAALPADDPSDQAVRDGLVDQVDSRERRVAWYTRSWIALVLAVGLLLGSLAHAARSPRRVLAALRPPSEVVFAAPVVAVLIATALTTHLEIGPAVAVISIGGLFVAWLSAAGLIAARHAGRELTARAALHGFVVLVAVAALAYIAIERGNLLDMIIETVKFGPES
jgi:hypothetical protein